MFSFNFHRISKLGYTNIPRPIGRGIRSYIARRQDGMTFIEVLIGMLIIAIASVGLMMGVTYGQMMLRNTMIADRALQELSSYVELWRGRIHAGMVGTSEWGGTGSRGEETILYSPDGDPLHDVVGTIYRGPIERLGTTPFNQNNFPYLTLEAYIVWERPGGEKETYADTLRLRTAVIPLAK